MSSRALARRCAVAAAAASHMLAAQVGPEPRTLLPQPFPVDVAVLLAVLAAVGLGLVLYGRRRRGPRSRDAAGVAPPAPGRGPEPRPAPPSRTRTVFVSYRRSDSADVTGRIYDRLAARFGGEHVFKDVDSIPIGVDFRKHVGDLVARCDALLAVIGGQWLRAEAGGARRIDDPSDLVRVEIASALARGIPVVPVLVAGAAVPGERELPEELRDLAYRNGTVVRPDPDFHNDLDRLIEGLEAHFRG